MTVPAHAAESTTPTLLLPPFVGRPNASSAILSLVADADTLKAQLRYRAVGDPEWITAMVDGRQIQNIELAKLKPATRYEFALFSADGVTPVENGAGSFITQRQTAQPFVFGIMSDAHVNPANPERDPVLRAAADTLSTWKPDFVMHLGDNMQTLGTSHGGPAAEPSHPPVFYAHWRSALGHLQATGGQFVLNGNWEGENGWHPEENKNWARTARMALAPAPTPDTYPEGGSPNQDYYAFTWGNALFISLNVTGYNTINHEHTRGPGKGDDWTLGKEQFSWLSKTLSQSDATWKFLFIHHSVGGNAGDDINTRYGRGGGRAAHIGEQAKVQELMQKYGVEVFFYGHDHVFTDMKVDGVHYICVGSAGAPWKFATDETGYEKFIPDSGFTLVSIDGNKANIKYIRADKNDSKGKELYNLDLTAKEK